MRVKVAAIAASICLALPFSVSLYAAEKQDADKTLTCKDGTTEHAGKGACSHHGGVEKGGASASAHENKPTDKDQGKGKK
jgi:hypothetical protein